jgi:hypothetical protein
VRIVVEPNYELLVVCRYLTVRFVVKDDDKNDA